MSGWQLGDSEFEISDSCTIWVCQGPPRCNLTEDEAVAAQEAKCVWCKRIILDEDGEETTVEPAAA